MNLRLRLLDWLISSLQHLADDHRTTHGLWPTVAHRHQQFYGLRENRSYYHALFRKPSTVNRQS